MFKSKRGALCTISITFAVRENVIFGKYISAVIVRILEIPGPNRVSLRCEIGTERGNSLFQYETKGEAERRQMP